MNLPKGVHATLGYENLYLSRNPAPPSFLRRQKFILLPDAPQLIAIPGQTLIPGWRITAVIDETVPTVPDPDPCSALFDMDQLSGPLTVRRRQPGDRFTPLGMSGSKKLQDFLTDAKVPRHLRDSIPIVLSGDQIIWLVGHRIDESTKVTRKTKQVLKLTFEGL